MGNVFAETKDIYIFTYEIMRFERRFIVAWNKFIQSENHNLTS